MFNLKKTVGATRRVAPTFIWCQLLAPDTTKKATLKGSRYEDSIWTGTGACSY